MNAAVVWTEHWVYIVQFSVHLDCADGAMSAVQLICACNCTEWYLVFSLLPCVLSCVFPLSTAELNIELSRPLKINPTLAKLEQAKSYLKKVFPSPQWDTPSKAPSTSSSPHCSPMKTLPRAAPPRTDLPRYASAGGFGTLGLSFHKVSLHAAQIVVVMETETHPVKPSVTVSVSGMKGSLNIKSGPRVEGESSYETTALISF